MAELIHLKDNDRYGKQVSNGSVNDIVSIANLGRLKDAPELLVFPNSFSEVKGDTDNLNILSVGKQEFDDDGKCRSLYVYTGNMMGFIGVNDTSISIHSRFDYDKNEAEHKDYFLYYMLEKVFSINIVKLQHSSTRNDRILDFLLFLFPYMLKRALSQGLYKEYRTFKYDNAHVRGTIDINRFIRNDIPFKGGISYNTREYSYDNSMTQLIRHTIEFIKHHPFGKGILNNDPETKRCVTLISLITPTYNKMSLRTVINANLKPKVHPYYTKYKALQQLCLRILRHDSLRYGKDKDKVHGILFDGAWLWEEYLAKVLQQDMQHLTKENSKKFYLFKEDNKKFQQIIPDFLSLKKKPIVGDAKYIRLGNKNDLAEDGGAIAIYYKTLTYMLRFNADKAFLFYPTKEDKEPRDLSIIDTDKHLYILGLQIAESTPYDNSNTQFHTNNFGKFYNIMTNKYEKKFLDRYNTILVSND